MNHDEIFRNRASADPDADPSQTCRDGEPGRRCDGTVLFAMRDRHHTFSLGLDTVLECLRLAEEEGEVPPLPSVWWEQVHGRYDLD